MAREPKTLGEHLANIYPPRRNLNTYIGSNVLILGTRYVDNSGFVHHFSLYIRRVAS
jgi:hypothetical protein